jgi:PhnB protein
MTNTSFERSIAPMLSVRGGSKAVEFYKAAFGAEEIQRLGPPDGSHIVAHLRFGGSDFWVSDESPEYQNFSPDSLNGSTCRFILVVEDPDAAFAKAIRAGGKEVAPVEDHDYGWRNGRMVDPFGHHWEIGRPL